MHCKDVRRDVFAGVQAKGWSFLDGVLAGMFTVPGDGGLDYGAVMRALADIGYSGWIVVEQDVLPGMGTPFESARRNRAFLRTLKL